MITVKNPWACHRSTFNYHIENWNTCDDMLKKFVVNFINGTPNKAQRQCKQAIKADMAMDLFHWSEHLKNLLRNARDILYNLCLEASFAISWSGSLLFLINIQSNFKCWTLHSLALQRSLSYQRYLLCFKNVYFSPNKGIQSQLVSVSMKRFLLNNHQEKWHKKIR